MEYPKLLGSSPNPTFVQGCHRDAVTRIGICRQPMTKSAHGLRNKVIRTTRIATSAEASTSNTEVVQMPLAQISTKAKPFSDFCKVSLMKQKSVATWQEQTVKWDSKSWLQGHYDTLLIGRRISTLVLPEYVKINWGVYIYVYYARITYVHCIYIYILWRRHKRLQCSALFNRFFSILAEAWCVRAAFQRIKHL